MPAINSAVIAGKSCGIAIEATPQAQLVFKNLEKQAPKNYWAHMVVSGIRALCSGQMSVDNVFVKEQTYSKGAKGSEFYVVLPGCTASMKKLPTGRYKLLHMTADMNYFEGQEKGLKPGTYKATKQADKWKANFKFDGIKPEKNRVVAICDSGYDTPNKAAGECINFIIKSPVSGGEFTINNDGFDMHYTPGKGRIGGLSNLKQAFNAETNSSLHESAYLLAKSMEDARNIKGVRWIAEQGGSGVLTQAMKILADKGITLDNHTVFLSNPRTQQHKVVELGIKLKLKKSRSISINNQLNPNELIGGLFFGVGGYYTAAKRLRHDNAYTKLNFIGDIAKETTNLNGAGGTTIAVGAAMGISAGVSLPAVFAFVGAVGAAMGISSKVAEAFIPRLYNKTKSKF
ncbi:MAG: hypothetical protein QM500_08685 [Methylococcales bacterium]